MQSVALLDCAGRRRSTGHARNLPPRASATQQGPSVPAGPAHREEIIAVMHSAGDDPDALTPARRGARDP
jgi:hypothetical protein